MLRFADTLQLALSALRADRRRSALIALATAIGVTAVVLLTALGDGARRYVTGQFSHGCPRTAWNSPRCGSAMNRHVVTSPFSL